MSRRIPEAGQLGHILSFQVSPEVAARIRAEAVAVERPVSQLLRWIVLEHFKAIDAQDAS